MYGTNHVGAHTNSPSLATIHASSQLQQIVSSWAQRQSFTSAVTVQQLTAGDQVASYRSTDSMVTASTYKVYVAYAVLYDVEHGKYSLKQTLSDGNTVQADLTTMILDSDNDTARTLGFLVGWKNIDTLLKAQGLSATNLYNYIPPSTEPVGDKHTTAQDMTTLLNKLYNQKLLNRTNTKMLIGLMERQYYRERIPAGTPNMVEVADKPGWLTPADGINEYVENDVAIIYGPKSAYILTIFTTSKSTQPLTELSRLVYNQLET